MFALPSLSTLLDAEWKFLKLFFPVLFLSMVSIGSSFATVLFAGRIDKNHLDGIGLANTIFNVVVTSLVAGYTTVFDTYGPQVYGSTQRAELGTVALKCAAQGGLIYLIALGPYLNLVYLVDSLPRDHDLGSVAVLGNITDGEVQVDLSFQDITIKYLRMTCGCGYMNFLVNIVAKYLAIQGHTNVIYLLSVANFSFHVLLNYVLVEVKNMGADGLGYATIGSNLFGLALSIGICFVMIKKRLLAWSGFSMKVLEGWIPMLKLGLSGIVNLLAELGLFEIATFMSQFDGTVTLSTVLIQFQIMSILYTAALAVSYASAVLMGNSLGESDPQKVKLYMGMTVANTLIESIPLALLAYGLRGSIVRIFANDAEIIDMFSTTLWLVCVLIPFDHLQGNLSRGILVSFGKQRFIAISMSVCCYVVALPIVILTVLFTDLKIYGIYIGFFAFEFLNSSAVIMKILKLDIQDEVEKTKVRVGEKEENPDIDLGMINPMYEENRLERLNGSTMDGLTLPADAYDVFACNRKSEQKQKEVKWIIVAFFGAVLSFLILSVVSLMK